MNLPKLILIAATVALAACASPKTHGVFIAAPSDIDARLNSAPIEDYILSFPPFQFHEESIAEFETRVRTAHSLAENQGKSKDYLYCPGDGCWPTKEFTLKRSSKRLIIEVDASDGGPGYVEIMKRVPGGWVRENGK